MNAMVGDHLYGNPNSHILQTRGVSRLPRRGVPISSLSEGSGYYTGGPVSLGGPEPRLLAHEFLPLPGHVVSLDLSQLWDGSGPLLGEQDSGPQGSGCLDVVKDNYKTLA